MVAQNIPEHINAKKQSRVVCKERAGSLLQRPAGCLKQGPPGRHLFYSLMAVGTKDLQIPLIFYFNRMMHCLELLFSSIGSLGKECECVSCCC